MIDARRKGLEKISLPGDNAGLALDTLLTSHVEGEVSKLLDKICEATFSEACYQAAFERWKKSLAATGIIFMEVELTTSLAIGLGNATPLEVGLSLHRTYGAPYLPGSALKGLCRRVALRSKVNEEEQKYFFGNTDYASAITFWDGWMLPQCKKPFKRDVVTVHHQSYYSKKGKESTFPTDFDDPIPIPFLTIRPGTKFLVALSAPSSDWKDWLQTAQELLTRGLEVEGLGAKINAGYGLFKCTEIETGISKALRQQITNIINIGMFNSLQFPLEELSVDDQQEAALLLKERLKELKWWKDKNKEKAAYKWVAERIRG